MKRILVTGGNKGIGKAICERLLKEWPDTVVLLGSRNADRGEAAVQDIAEALGAAKIKDRLSVLELDTSQDASVEAAAKKCGEMLGSDGKLYGIINNAGIGFGYSLEETINVNYFGPRRVNDAFADLLQTPGGRIVNVASASGPNFLKEFKDGDELKTKLHTPWVLPGKVADLDELARSGMPDGNAYGASKALLNAYTVLHAKANTGSLIINSVTPGYIDTDLTAGFGAPGKPAQGAVPPCFLMMDEETIPKEPTGRYYGSDCKRSPLHFYRGPGEPVYEGTEDLVSMD